MVLVHHYHYDLVCPHYIQCYGPRRGIGSIERDTFVIVRPCGRQHGDGTKKGDREFSLKLWHCFLVCRDVVGVLSMDIPYCNVLYCTVLARDSLSATV
jgi:hypothetical protein